jgi:hypothetical protein
MVFFKIKTAKYILGNGNKIFFKVTGYSFIKMDKDIKANLKKTKNMDKECIIT